MTWVPSTLMSTPDGMSTGIFPIRLISPDLAHDLAAETTAASLSVGEQTLAGGDHCDAKAALDAGQLRRAAVDPVTGLGNPLDALDGGLAAVAVAEHQFELAAGHLRP